MSLFTRVALSCREISCGIMMGTGIHRYGCVDAEANGGCNLSKEVL